MEAMELKLTPMIAMHHLCPLGMFEPIAGTSGLIASPNSPNRWYNLPPPANLPLPPTSPLIHVIYDSTVDVKK